LKAESPFLYRTTNYENLSTSHKMKRLERNLCAYACGTGHAVAQLVEALCYKPEGHGIES
jgi:hypothetical protein